MPLGSILTWIANHIGLGSVKNITGIYKDKVDIKKAKLEAKKLERDLNPPPLVQPATFEDVKNYDPKVRAISAKDAVDLYQEEAIAGKKRRIVQIIILILTLIATLLITIQMPLTGWIRTININSPQPVESPKKP